MRRSSGRGRGLKRLLGSSLILFGVVAVSDSGSTLSDTIAATAEQRDEPCPGIESADCALSAVLISSSDVVLVGQTLGVSMRVTNNTEREVRAVTPSISSTGGSGGVTLLSGPLPPLAIIPVRQSQAFAFTFLVTDAVTITFRGSAEGVQEGFTRAIRSREVTSEPVTAQLPLLTTTLSASPEKPNPGQILTMTLTVTNTGKRTTSEITPSVVSLGDSALTRFIAGPEAGARSLASGASQSFRFAFRVNAEGPLTFSGKAVGTDTETGKPVASPEASSRLTVAPPQSLTARLVATPTPVALKQAISLALTVENGGAQRLDAVVPSLVTPSNPGSVRLLSGRTPVSATLAPGAAQVFTFAYQASKVGTFHFAGQVVGTDSASKRVVKSPRVTSNDVTVTSLLADDLSAFSPEDLQTIGSTDGEAEAADRSKNSPPLGYLHIPRSDAKVGGIVSIAGGVFDREDHNVFVTILLDGDPLASVLATTGTALDADSKDLVEAGYVPFSFEWDTTATTPGPHTLAVQAADSQGESTIFGIRTVTVIGPNNPPIGFLDLPFPNATIGGAITVAGWAVDREDPTVALTILLDGTPLATPVPADRPELETIFQSIPWARHSGFIYEWDTDTIPPGPHTLAILATDSQGESTLFGTRTVTVTGSSNSPPFGFFVPPPAIARAGTTVPLIGTALDREGEGVTVIVFLDGIPIGSPLTVSANGGFQFRWDTTTTEVGSHTVAVEATDSEGASAIIGIRKVTLVR